jgi:predicted oxidoreductase
LAAYLAEANFDRLPPHAVEAASQLILDNVGVTLAGSRFSGALPRFVFADELIDDAARVMGLDGQPCAGLLATGEITGGFFYQNYPAGAGLMSGAVFGRIAGRNAAARARAGGTSPGAAELVGSAL